MRMTDDALRAELYYIRDHLTRLVLHLDRVLEVKRPSRLRLERTTSVSHTDVIVKLDNEAVT